MATMKEVVIAQCGACGGTGLYEGMCEKEGEPVICLNCNGSGGVKLSYTPYTGRKGKRGVKCVRFSRGSFIATGVGGVGGTEMSYDEFQKKVPELKIGA